ncbi:MAG: hypothetical protein GTN62_15730 [Gemmatimonadales bacterium]|nr:hypothetical protein [Gemmatimonadales bacterium]NIN13543.1 hypothetical protein [Gemmatimonadales bacterium]NIN51537.1 hypothetical protein [Gemmatimonadales bacterium]NIP09001.1 hypothetical protein [Gemmatimonadales bacterium]NIR03779.1 hypothetical protein [Gemmatimonadales bacterium]
MASLRLTVTGMTCGHCQSKVEEALKSVDGVYGAFVDLPGGTAEVDFDGAKVAPTSLVEAVEVAGYGAKLAD